MIHAVYLRRETDSVQVALTRFKRTLRWARLSVRQLTHTLHLPPAQTELYDGPHPEWLRDVLEALPNLQSLIVPRLPFFDHQALLALRDYGKGRRLSANDDRCQCSLRLLIAAHCENMTSSSLTEALRHCSNLVYIDVSNNVSARDHTVLQQLQNMPNLQVLRMRNCQLRDTDTEVLGASIGIRVRSLDVRGNQLTDATVRTLLHHCFKVKEVSERPCGSRFGASSGVIIEASTWADWPSGYARPNARILDEFQDESLNDHFIRRLTRGIVSRLPSQDLQQAGLTHLYITDNHLSVEGVSSLIKSKQLCVLDVGHLDTTKAICSPHGVSPLSSATSSQGPRVSIPGAEKLAPVLEAYGHEMTYLRLHHSVVTKVAPAKDDDALRKARPLEENSQRHELDATEQIFELPIDEPAPRYELLAGDAMHVVSTPATGEMPSLDDGEDISTARRRSIYAPETVSETNDNDVQPLLSATGLGTVSQASNSPGIPERHGSNDTRKDGRHGNHAIGNERDGLVSRNVGQPHGLLPGMLPQLRTLVLTNVPCSGNSEIAESLINFIRASSSEAAVAEIQVCAEFGPLNDLCASAVDKARKSARDIFSLRHIVLEMGPPGSTGSSVASYPSNTPQSSSRTKSATEDPDSEALWSAQENDFSFFDDDEECGLSSRERLNLPSAVAEKVPLPANEMRSKNSSTVRQPPSTDSGLDVVQALASYRREKKAAFEDARRHGKRHVDGYWSGEVKIVRWHAETKNQAEYYGNNFVLGS